MKVHLDGREQSFEELVARAPYATLILFVLAMTDALKRHFGTFDEPAANKPTPTKANQRRYRST
jgi:hypothetical protein